MQHQAVMADIGSGCVAKVERHSVTGVPVRLVLMSAASKHDDGRNVVAESVIVSGLTEIVELRDLLLKVAPLSVAEKAEQERSKNDDAHTIKQLREKISAAYECLPSALEGKSLADAVNDLVNMVEGNAAARLTEEKKRHYLDGIVQDICLTTGEGIVSKLPGAVHKLKMQRDEMRNVLNAVYLEAKKHTKTIGINT